jgi:hypothetical protein
MLYVLHHSKGVLMLTARNREQVEEWSRRQLGSGAKLISISERDGMDSVESVERSGTGIQAAIMEGCRPALSFMPNHGTVRPEVRQDHKDRGPLLRGQDWSELKPTWH